MAICIYVSCYCIPIYIEYIKHEVNDSCWSDLELEDIVWEDGLKEMKLVLSNDFFMGEFRTG